MAVVYAPFVDDFGVFSAIDSALNRSSEVDLKLQLLDFHRESESSNTKCALDIELVVYDVDSLANPWVHVIPVNTARNRALMHTNAEAIFLLDIDFLPSVSLVQFYRQNEAWIHFMYELVQKKTAFVVPAFGHADFLPSSTGGDVRLNNYMDLLKNKTAMGVAWKNRYIPYIYEKQFPRGHGPTNFSRWITSDAAFPIAYEQDYEPYVIVAKQYVPWYDERFVLFYHDKSAHLEHLWSLNVKFKVHGSGYVLHRPHPKAPPLLHATSVASHWHHTGKYIAPYLVMRHLHEAIRGEIANGTYVPVTIFDHCCPKFEPPNGFPVVAVVEDPKKWARN